MSEDQKPGSERPQMEPPAGVNHTYRDEDGRPHLTEAMEKAARGAQRARSIFQMPLTFWTRWSPD